MTKATSRGTWVMRSGKLVTKEQAATIDAAAADAIRKPPVKYRRAKSGTWVVRNGQLVEKHLAGPMQPAPDKRSPLAMPYIAPDRVEYQSMVDGKMITGRKQHRDHLRAYGMTEVGNEKPKAEPAKRKPKIDKKQLKNDIAQAFEMVEQGYRAPRLPKLGAPEIVVDTRPRARNKVIRAGAPK